MGQLLPKQYKTLRFTPRTHKASKNSLNLKFFKHWTKNNEKISFMFMKINLNFYSKFVIYFIFTKNTINEKVTLN